MKQDIKLEEMAIGLYHSMISDTKMSLVLKDLNGEEILNKKEQSLLLVSHICDLLDINDFGKAKSFIINAFVVNNYKIKNDKDLMFQIVITQDYIVKIKQYFQNFTLETINEFIKKKFIFDKELKPIQKTLVMNWYVESCKLIDSVFQSTIDKFNVIKY